MPDACDEWCWSPLQAGSLIARFGMMHIILTGILLLTGHLPHPVRNGILLFRLGACPTRCRVELPLRRRHQPADYYVHRCRKAQGASHQRPDNFHCRPGCVAERGHSAMIGWQQLSLMLLPWLAGAAGAIVWRSASVKRATLREVMR